MYTTSIAREYRPRTRAYRRRLGCVGEQSFADGVKVLHRALIVHPRGAPHALKKSSNGCRDPRLVGCDKLCTCETNRAWHATRCRSAPSMPAARRGLLYPLGNTIGAARVGSAYVMVLR